MSFVPVEFVGLARDFERRLVVADQRAAAEVPRILAPIRARYARNPVPRKEMLIDLARQWRRDIPPFGRIGLSIDLAPKAIAVREHRACSAQMHWPQWGLEPGVVVVLTGFDVRRDVFQDVAETYALVSRHALARRFQRGRRRDDAAILADLGRLVGAANPSVIPTPDGAWVGEGIEARGRRLLSMRSFLEPGQAARPVPIVLSPGLAA